MPSMSGEQIGCGRMIRKTISQSSSFASLSKESQVLFCMMIPHYDNYGKMNGSPYFIKGQVCPKIEWATISVIAKCLAEISEKTNVKWFEINGVYCLHSLHWDEHQQIRYRGADMEPSYPGLKIIGPSVGAYPTEKERHEIYERDGFICKYCGVDMKKDSKLICLDHVIPLSRSGTNSKNNLVTSCRRCNAHKSDRTPEEAGMKKPSGFGETAGSVCVDPVKTPSTHPFGADPVKTTSTSPLDEVEVEVEVEKEIEIEKEIENTTCTETSSVPLITFPCVGRGAKEWYFTQKFVDDLKSAYPAIDILAEARKAFAWCKTNPKKQKTASGMPAFLNKWFSRAQDSGKAFQSAGTGTKVIDGKYEHLSK